MATTDREGAKPVPSPSSKRRLAAVMFSDIVGYTAMTQTNESLALEVLEEHRALLRPLFSTRKGREIKTIGDAFLVEFESALDAVSCAVEMQQALSRRNSESTSTRRVQIRIGIHVGDVVTMDEDVYGDTVNIASRIENLAEPGGIAISALMFEQIKNKIDFPIQAMGEYRLKNVGEPVLVYKVSPTWEGVKSGRLVGGSLRLAVMPLENIGAGQDDEYLAEGLTEELISVLSGLPSLKVIARTSVNRYKGTTKNASEIGKELNVGAILEGSVRRSASRLRVTMKLVNTGSEECLWTERYDRGIEDVLAVQDDIASRVTEALRGRMIGDGARRRKVTEDPEAFILYLKAKHHLSRHTEGEVREAASLFQRAAEKDPSFASAQAMLAQCYLFLGFFGLLPPEDAFAMAKPPLKRALELDPDLDVAHMLMGRLLMDHDWDWSGAEAEFRRAIELSPNSAEAHYRYALLLHDMGRNEPAIAELRAAEELDPLSVAVNQVSGTVLYYLGRYDEAIERFQRAIEMDPHAALAHNNLGQARFQKGQVEEGIREAKKAIEADPRNTMFKVDLCYLYSKSGRMDEARRLLIQTEEAARTEHIPSVAIAGMYACVGENEKALDWLEKAYAEHSPYLASLKVERWFEALRRDRRFISLVQKVGLSPS